MGFRSFILDFTCDSDFTCDFILCPSVCRTRRVSFHGYPSNGAIFPLVVCLVFFCLFVFIKTSCALKSHFSVIELVFNGPTDRPTDKPCYQDARTHLKKVNKTKREQNLARVKLTCCRAPLKKKDLLANLVTLSLSFSLSHF